MQIEAEAQAQATRMAAEADAQVIKIKSDADKQVLDPFSREMELRRMEVTRIQAFGNKTIFVPNEASSSQMANLYQFGLATAMGAEGRP